MRKIKTVEGIIEALGGNTVVARALGEMPNTVGNWKTRERISSRHYVNVESMLNAIGMTAPPILFGMKSMEAAE